LYFA
jgi:hypothetical protein